VEPALRNKGVGSRLVVRAMQEANRLGHNDLYLFTPDRQTFYARLGWREIEKCLYRNYPMSVMQYDFAKLSDLSAPA
jgi:N-acetylglutamate synthase-like GNAT family acetyltransferase